MLVSLFSFALFFFVLFFLMVEGNVCVHFYYVIRLFMPFLKFSGLSLGMRGVLRGRLVIG